MPGAPEALGERFREAREGRGLSISDVAEQIRIRAVYLAAIEDENWNTIGAPVYIRGFLRTYARFIGMDPEEVVAAFNRTQAGAQTAAAAPRNDGADGEDRDPRSSRSGSLLIWIAATVAVLLIAFVVYNELTLRSASATATAAPGSVAASSPSASASVPPAGPTPAAQPSVLAGAGEKSLALVLSAPSWLMVTVDGNVSMEGTFPAGTSKTFHGKLARVRIGNAGGVEIYVDGKDVGKLGKSGDVVEQAFTL
jgi:cytoskeleton protein RodZ